MSTDTFRSNIPGKSFNIDSTIQSTSISSGSLVIAGGVGITKDIYAGGNMFLSGRLDNVSGIGSTTGVLGDIIYHNGTKYVQINGGSNTQILQINSSVPTWVNSTTVGVTAHSALTGLTNDDHIQYLLVNGSRAMGGELDMGGFNFDNVAGFAGTTGFLGDIPIRGATEYIRLGGGTTNQILSISASVPTWISQSSIIHSSLGSLTSDDHTQYLLVNGSRAMGGELDMGGFNFDNVGGFAGTTGFLGDIPIRGATEYIRLGGGTTNQILSISASVPTWISQSAIIHSSLGSLTSDDHTQYLPINGSRAMTGILVTNNTTQSTAVGNGALVIDGGASVAKDVRVGGNIVVTGDVTINGVLTSINSTTVNIGDNLLVLNAGPSTTRDGGLLVQRFQTANNTPTGDVIADTAAATGTATAGTSTTITFPNTAPFNTIGDSGYNGWWIRITAGTGINQVRRIKTYVGATRIATIYATADGGTDGLDWTVTPDGTSVFSLFPCSYISSFYDTSTARWTMACSALDQVSAITIVDYTDMAIKGLTMFSTVESVSTSTGALICGGGISTPKSIHAGAVQVDNVNINGSTITGSAAIDLISTSNNNIGLRAGTGLIQVVASGMDLNGGYLDNVSGFNGVTGALGDIPIRNGSEYTRLAGGTTNQILSIVASVPTWISQSSIIHSSLGSLTNDDHTQYLLVNGSRAMAGQLNMDGFRISNISMIGLSSTSGTVGGVALGVGANASTTGSIAIGSSVISTTDNSITLGSNINNTVASSFLVGTAIGTTSQYLMASTSNAVTNPLLTKVNVNTMLDSNTTISATVLTPQCEIISTSTSAGAILTLPTAAQLVTANNYIRVGDGFRFNVRNEGASTWAVAINTGITSKSGNNLNIGASQSKEFLLVANNVSASTESWTLYETGSTGDASNSYSLTLSGTVAATMSDFRDNAFMFKIVGANSGDPMAIFAITKNSATNASFDSQFTIVSSLGNASSTGFNWSWPASSGIQVAKTDFNEDGTYVVTELGERKSIGTNYTLTGTTSQLIESSSTGAFYVIIRSVGMTGAPISIFFISKNVATNATYDSFNAVVTSVGSVSGTFFNITWVASSGITVAKSDSNANGTYFIQVQ